MTIGSSASLVDAAAAVVTIEDHEMSTWIFAVAVACGIWYFLILVVQAIGFIQMYVRHQIQGEASC
jgi:hypothetical protein